MKRSQRVSIAAVTVIVTAMALAALPAMAQQDHRHARFAQRHDDHQRQATAGARPEVRRRHQERRAAVQALVGTARRAAEGRAERAADHHRRRRLRRAEHLRRRDPDADHGPHRAGGPALQPHVLHRAVLADARRADHRAQPPLGRLRRDLRAVHRLPRLQQHHRQGQGHDRPHPARQRLRHRRGSARTTTRRPSRPARSGPFDQWPTGMGFEYFYGFVGGDANQWQPNLFRNTTQIYPFEGKRRAPGT